MHIAGVSLAGSASTALFLPTLKAFTGSCGELGDGIATPTLSFIEFLAAWWCCNSLPRLLLSDLTDFLPPALHSPFPPFPLPPPNSVCQLDTPSSSSGSGHQRIGFEIHGSDPRTAILVCLVLGTEASQTLPLPFSCSDAPHTYTIYWDAYGVS